MALDLDDDRILGSLLEGKWRLVRRIGRGGMGQVFQVVHSKMGIVKCVKILRPEAEEVLHKRFEREVRLAQQIRHENVIRIDDFGLDSDLDPAGVPFYIMEYVEGQSLRDVMGGREIPVARTCHLLRQVALGTHAAHEQDIVHRDIKPENIVVTKDDRVTVLDFGIAKLRSPDSREDMLTLTRRGEIWATPQYMSPEQAMALPDLTHRADIYSLGIVLFECVTGDLPFPGNTARDFIIAHVQKDVPSVREQRPELSLPKGLEELINSMLSKRAENRPATMKDVADALDAIGTGAEPSIAAPSRPSPPTIGTKPRHTPSKPARATVVPPRSVRREDGAQRRSPRVVVVPHPPDDAAVRGTDFRVRAHLYVNLGEELHEHLIGRPRVTIGRRTTNDILIPDTMASKLHAELREEGGRFVLEDLHSRNGIYVGEQRVKGTVPLPKSADLRIGHTLMRFVEGDAAVTDFYTFCDEGHPNEPQARFCGSCGQSLS